MEVGGRRPRRTGSFLIDARGLFPEAAVQISALEKLPFDNTQRIISSPRGLYAPDRLAAYFRKSMGAAPPPPFPTGNGVGTSGGGRGDS